MMSMNILALVIIAVLFAGIALAARPTRDASKLDFYLAGQRVGVITNASAICGDYFSAASFLGVAAAVYISGLDGLWYAAGFAAGFVPLLLFVVAPLRRFGQYSIPDFLGSRFKSDAVRLTAVVIVELVIVSYLVPQAVGSGIAWELLIGVGFLGLAPYNTGVLASTLVIGFVVVIGGMRGTTWNQAVQFVVLMGILVWLAVLAVGVGGFEYPAAVSQADAGVLADPVQRADGAWALEPLQNNLGDGQPARFGEPGSRYGHVGQFALLITLMFGTAGLPHVLNRYFTSPSGRAARMTTVWVLGLAGAFYAIAVMLGTAARVMIPEAAATRPWLAELTVDGVLRVPEHAMLVLGRLLGGVGGLGLVATGALVAIMSTVSGLLLAAAASWGHDVYERYINPAATQRQAVWAGRWAVLAVGSIAAWLGVLFDPSKIHLSVSSTVATMVTWAFALAGSALTPVVIISIWWRRATAHGALAGMVTGAVVTVSMVIAGLVLGSDYQGAAALLLTPTAVSGVASVLAMWVVSRRGAECVDIDQIWIQLHGTAQDRVSERMAKLTVKGVGP